MKPWRTADGQIVGVLLFAEVITDQVTARSAPTGQRDAVPCAYRA